MSTVRAIARRRRRELLAWLRARPLAHEGLTTREIAEASGVYATGARRRCTQDLAALELAGVVYRSGRPARWHVMRVDRSLVAARAAAIADLEEADD